MRHLILLRGLPGSGKTKFIEDNHLEPFTLSSDAVRMMMSGLTLDTQGNFYVSQERTGKIWKLLNEILEERMKRGEFLVLDAPNIKPEDISLYKKLATKYRYKLYIIDFTDVDFETLIKRNKERDGYYKISLKDLDRMHRQLLESKPLSKVFEIIKPEDFDTKFANYWHDYSSYNAIHIIGDIQGCYTPLKKLLTKLQHGNELLNKDELYIFAGDLLDRGPEDDLVMELMLQIYSLPNVILHEGNHEKHFWDWARGLTAKASRFESETKPKLESAQLDKKEIRKLYRKTRIATLFKYHQYKILVSHGGLPIIPKRLAYVPAKQIIKGVGYYIDARECAQTFAASTDEYTFQAHGHRNQTNEPIQYLSTFNLEGSVEFGGYLRAVTLTKNGFTPHQIHFPIKNNDDTTTKFETSLDSFGNKHWVHYLQKSDFVYKKTFGNISCYSLKKTAFNKDIWISQTFKAKVMFFNTNTSEIVIRSYNKIFNLGQREETQGVNLREYFNYPIKSWLKENGYRGLIGHDAQTDELVYASKSSLDNEYVSHFKQLLLTQLGPDKLKEIKSFTKEHNVTLAFEIIDPQFEPRIIEYPEAQLVLLEAIKRQYSFEILDTELVEKFANKLGIKYKKKIRKISNFYELKDIIDELTTTYNLLTPDETLRYKEGVVLEDGSHHLKVKTFYYTQWKYMRAYLQRLIKNPNKEYLGNPQLSDFVKWYKHSYLNITTSSIPELRNLYLSQ